MVIMNKKFVIFMGLSLMSASTVSAFDGGFNEETRAALAIMQLKHQGVNQRTKKPEKVSPSLKAKKSVNKGAAAKGGKPKKPGRKNRLKVVDSIPDAIFYKYAQKHNGVNFVSLTSSEKKALKRSLKESISRLPNGKFSCDICIETRGNYERMASHIATLHHDVERWREAPGKPSYENYTGLKTSIEMKRWKK